jgi:signal transduction histidine kinase
MSNPTLRVEASPHTGQLGYPALLQCELEERSLRRIGAELHNGPAQLIGLALLQLDSLMPSAGVRPDDDNNEGAVGTIRASLQQAMREIRALSAELAPGLDKLSLSQVIRAAISNYECRTGAAPTANIHSLPAAGRLDLKNSVYRFVEEGLRYTSTHAKNAGARVEATCEGDTLCIEVIIASNGLNADPSEVSWLRRRVEARGGQFKIESLRGAETRLSARFRVSERNAFDE